jgi:hypothetical protein
MNFEICKKDSKEENIARDDATNVHGRIKVNKKIMNN